jgi:hypothetical protein
MIEDKGLYPITMLKLSKIELFAFSQIHLMMAADLLSHDPTQLSMQTGISPSRLSRLQGRARQILH